MKAKRRKLVGNYSNVARQRAAELDKQSTRLEFERDQLKQIYEAAELENRSAKNFMETSVIAATLQTLTKKK